MQVPAHVARAAAFHKVHADGDEAVRRVHLHVIGRMGEAAVAGTALAVAALELPANLAEERSAGGERAATDLQPVGAARRRRLGRQQGGGRVQDGAEVRQLVGGGHEAGDEGERRVWAVSGASGHVRAAGGGLWTRDG